MAIVPLLLIKIMVMMAIRRRGYFVPPIVKMKTSLGSGQGTVVDIRTVMYESRKQLKIKVSLRRKIHIMALPQVAVLNARWSEDQSAAKPCQPPGCAGASNVSVSAGSVICTPDDLSEAFPGAADTGSRSENAPIQRNQTAARINRIGQQQQTE